VEAVNLGDELRLCVDDLTLTIDAIKARAQEVGGDPYYLVTSAGVPLLAPLLAAKAECLSALARHPGRVQ
jgi:hypothetical protein